MIVLLISLLLVIPLALLRGVVLVDLFAWFTPFHPHIVQAMGISILVALLTHDMNSRTDGETSGERLTNAVVKSIIVSLSAWGFGYLYHLFM